MGSRRPSIAINTHTTGSQTILATTGHLDGNGNYVFDVSSLNFQNHETLTIDGTGLAANQDVVINMITSISAARSFLT